MRKRVILKGTKYANGESYIRLHGLGKAEEYNDPALYSTFPQGTSRFQKEIALWVFTGKPCITVKQTFIPYWKKDEKT